MILIKYVLMETPEELRAYMEADETREKQRQAAASAKSDTKEEAAANKRVPVLGKIEVGKRGDPKYIYEITDTKGDKRIVTFTDIYRIFGNAGYTNSKSGLRYQFDRDEKVSFGGFVAERRPR